MLDGIAERLRNILADAQAKPEDEREQAVADAQAKVEMLVGHRSS